MRRRMVGFCTLTLLLGIAWAGDYDARLEESRVTVREFMQLLKAELQKGMQEGGPLKAISVCEVAAPGIAESYSKTNGWRVGRTSLKVRNPLNAPDAWEQDVLQAFERRKAAGENPTTIEFYEAVELDGKAVFRYMKAIPTTELCVGCHGSQIDPSIDARIRELYPSDQARGFKPGDIRGAFTITQPLGKAKQ